MLNLPHHEWYACRGKVTAACAGMLSIAALAMSIVSLESIRRKDWVFIISIADIANTPS